MLQQNLAAGREQREDGRMRIFTTVDLLVVDTQGGCDQLESEVQFTKVLKFTA